MTRHGSQEAGPLKDEFGLMPHVTDRPEAVANVWHDQNWEGKRHWWMEICQFGCHFRV